MNITEIQVSIAPEEYVTRDGVLAFARLVFEGVFLVRDITIMERSGFLCLGMPSRKMTKACLKCGKKVTFLDLYCCHCGAKQPPIDPLPEGKRSCYVDVAHPIAQAYRQYMEEKVADTYNSLVQPNKRLKIRGRDGQPIQDR